VNLSGDSLGPTEEQNRFKLEGAAKDDSMSLALSPERIAEYIQPAMINSYYQLQVTGGDNGQFKVNYLVP
jgi:hypothetical protein